MDIKKLVENLSKKGTKNTLYNILIIFLIGVFVIIVTSFFDKKGTIVTNSKAEETVDNKQESNDNQLSQYEQKQKEQLRFILEKIDGVGNIEVSIYFESGEEHIPALDVNHSNSTTQEKDNAGGVRETIQNNDGSKVVMTNTGKANEPLILKTYRPKVTGVIIVAQGAEDKKIKYDITKAVAGYYNIAENKVNVYSMKR